MAQENQTEQPKVTNPKQLAKQEKAAKAARKRLQKINKEIVKQQTKLKALENKLKTTSNPRKKADIQAQIKKVNDKIKKLNDPAKNRSAQQVLQTWSKGLGKEASRIAWEKKEKISKDFVTIIVVSVILAIIFFAIDMIIITIRK